YGKRVRLQGSIRCASSLAAPAWSVPTVSKTEMKVSKANKQRARRREHHHEPKRQVPGYGQRPHGQSRHYQPGLVAKQPKSQSSPPALVTFKPHGRGFRLRRGVFETRLLGP